MEEEHEPPERGHGDERDEGLAQVVVHRKAAPQVQVQRRERRALLQPGHRHPHAGGGQGVALQVQPEGAEPRQVLQRGEGEGVGVRDAGLHNGQEIGALTLHHVLPLPP